MGNLLCGHSSNIQLKRYLTLRLEPLILWWILNELFNHDSHDYFNDRPDQCQYLDIFWRLCFCHLHVFPSPGMTPGGWWSRDVFLRIIIWSEISCISNMQLSDRRCYYTWSLDLEADCLKYALLEIPYWWYASWNQLSCTWIVYTSVPQTLPVKVVIKLGGKIVPHIQLWTSFQTWLVARCLTGNSKLPVMGPRDSSQRRGDDGLQMMISK